MLSVGMFSLCGIGPKFLELKKKCAERSHRCHLQIRFEDLSRRAGTGRVIACIGWQQVSDDGDCGMDYADIVTRLRRDVVARQPVDERERLALVSFVDAFDRLVDPLSQESDPVHVTGSAFVVGPRGVVLLKHKRLGIWLQPGGHIDPGEAPWDAALRESSEETGLDLEFAEPVDADGVPPLLHVDVHAGGRGHTHLDVRYLVQCRPAARSDDPDPPDGESQEIGWFDWDAAIERAEPGLEGILRDLRP